MNALMLYFIACVILVAGCTYMILAPCYEDGILGKVGLLTIALGAVVFILKTCGGEASQPPPSAILIVCGSAIFIVRHVLRFLKFKRIRDKGSASAGAPFHRRLHDSIQ